MSRRIDWDKLNRQKRVNDASGTPAGTGVIGKAAYMPYRPDLLMTAAQREWYEQSKMSYSERKNRARATAWQLEKQERLRSETAMLERLKQKFGMRKR